MAFKLGVSLDLSNDLSKIQFDMHCNGVDSVDIVVGAFNSWGKGWRFAK